MIHDLKIWPAFYEAVAQGLMTAQLRRNDRDYHMGDILNLREWDPVQQDYTGRGLTVDVIHVMRVRELDADFKTVMGLNPCTSAINSLALLSIKLI